MKKVDYKSSNNSKYSNKIHIVWSTKYRHKLITESIQPFLKEIFKNISLKYNFEILEMEVMSDHIHILIEFNPDIKISTVVKLLKGISSKILKKNFKFLNKHKHIWTRSYFCSSVGGAPLSIVKQYIENQKIND